MKTIRFILLIVLLILCGMALYHILRKTPFFREDPVYIAVVGPMSGPDKKWGDMMVKGINLYLDEAKHDLVEKSLAERKIELLVFDDQNDAQLAAQIATDIARENKALLVIGHYDSTTSLAAGNVYKRAGIPAITASVTDERVTVEVVRQGRNLSLTPVIGTAPEDMTDLSMHLFGIPSPEGHYDLKVFGDRDGDLFHMIPDAKKKDMHWEFRDLDDDVNAELKALQKKIEELEREIERIKERL